MALPRYRLIFGRRRLEAYRTHRDLLGKEVEAMVYPEDLPEIKVRRQRLRLIVARPAGLLRQLVERRL